MPKGPKESKKAVPKPNLQITAKKPNNPLKPLYIIVGYCWEKFLLRSYTRFFGKQRSNQLASTIQQTSISIRTTSFEHSSGSRVSGSSKLRLPTHTCWNPSDSWQEQHQKKLVRPVTYPTVPNNDFFFCALLPSREGSRKKGKTCPLKKALLHPPENSSGYHGMPKMMCLGKGIFSFQRITNLGHLS